MNKIKIGDHVQFTLERAVQIEIDGNVYFSDSSYAVFDPFNAVFEVKKIADDRVSLLLVGSKEISHVFELKLEYLVRVEGEPRYIERKPEERQSKDDYYLGIAKQVASRSTCLRRKYGAVIVRNDVIISTGYNGSPRHSLNCSDRGLCVRQVMNMAHNTGNYDLCRSVHAEQNAIINAARQGTSLLDGILYLYGYDCVQKKVINATPCPICERMIRNAGIKLTISSKETPLG